MINNKTYIREFIEMEGIVLSSTQLEYMINLTDKEKPYAGYEESIKFIKTKLKEAVINEYGARLTNDLRTFLSAHLRPGSRMDLRGSTDKQISQLLLDIAEVPDIEGRDELYKEQLVELKNKHHKFYLYEAMNKEQYRRFEKQKREEIIDKIERNQFNKQ